MADENNNQYYTSQQDNQQPYPLQGYNQFNGNMPQQPPQEEKASVGLAILSFIIPLVGIILFFVKKKDKPKTAKACGICALVAIILNIVLTIIMTVGTGALVGEAIDETLNDSAYSEKYNDLDANTEEGSTNTSDNVIGDYGCVVKEATLCKDWQGKDAVLITYEFTNNSNNAASFDFALSDNVYQDGIGLESAILDDDTDILDVEIKPGVTKDVKKAYLLRDTQTPLEVEISEWISFNDDKLVTTVNIK